MRAFDAIRRSGVAIGPERTITTAAGVMDEAGVGALAVVAEGRLVGIVTDRDLVRRGVARRLSPEARVDSVMSAPVVTIDADADAHEAFALFRDNAVRRLAVTRDDRFVGMVTIDDLLIDIVSDLVDLSRPVGIEIIRSHRDSPVPQVV